MVTQTERKLYELYGARLTSSGTWAAGSGAIFDLITERSARRVGLRRMPPDFRFFRDWFAMTKSTS